jgi:two-component system sensor histidine kinase TtrS
MDSATAMSAVRRACSAAWRVLALGLALTPTVPASAAPSPDAPEIRIGVMAPEGASDVMHTWEFLAPTLERALPGHRVHLESLDVATLRGVVARSQADFFIANSGFCVEMESAHGATALATVDGPLADSPQKALGSAVVALASRRDLRRLADLDGKRVVAVSEQLFGGYQVAMHALHDAGVTRDDLAGMRFVGYDVDRLLEDLLANRADAAILRRCLFEKLTRSPRFQRAAFRVLPEQPPDRSGRAVSTSLYPDWAFARLKGTDPGLAKQAALAKLLASGAKTVALGCAPQKVAAAK